MWLDIEILKELLTELGGDVSFDTAVVVKMSPHSHHSHPIKIWRLKFVGETMIAYDNQNVFKIEISESSPLCNSLIQRLGLIKAGHSKKL
jgi:hypothetical protein